MFQKAHDEHAGASTIPARENLRHEYTNKQNLLARLKPKKTSTFRSKEPSGPRVFDRSTPLAQRARSRGLAGAILNIIPGTTRLIDARVAKERNADIDRRLGAERKHLRSLGYPRRGPHIHVLLFGNGDSGKQTLLQDLKLNLEGPYSAEERKWFRGVVWSNMIQGMQGVLYAMERSDVEIEDAELETCRKTILEAEYRVGGEALPDEYRDAVLRLRENEKVKKYMSLMQETELPTRCKFFLAEAENITAPGYLPPNKDILYSHGGPSGITAKTFREGPRWKYQFVEFGVSRGERKKWIHFFEMPEIAILTVDISSYAHKIYEDQHSTPLHESLMLFESIKGSRWLGLRTNFILLFTKMDQFRENLVTTPLGNVFPDYNGTTWQDAANHVKDVFRRSFYEHDGQVSASWWRERMLRVHFWDNFPEIPVASSITDLIQDIIVEEMMTRCGPCL